MQQIERKTHASKFQPSTTHAERRANVSSFSPDKVTLPVVPGCALREYLVNSPMHIRLMVEKMLADYRAVYTAVSQHSLIQYLVSDVLNPNRSVTALHKALASSPYTPATVLEELRGCGHADVLVRIAENPNTSEETLTELACEADSEVRAAVCDNKRASAIVQWQLCADPNPDVRYRQAENPNTPLRILIRHLQDENPYVATRARYTMSLITKVTL